jgi:hypothetical protein
MGHWGPHFPRIYDPVTSRFSYRHWGRRARGRHFPEARPVGVVPPVSPTGAGAFELVLEQSAMMTLAWKTGLSKAFDGREKRSSIVEDPAARFEGDALMVEAHTRAARARLVRYAAQGSAFLLGLPWEGVPIVLDSPLYTVNVPQTAALDWAVPGMPAIIHDSVNGSLVVTVQSTTATSILVDVPDGTPLGARGNTGAFIMPAVAIYLDAQQGFVRYQRKLERWQLKGRNANPGFQQGALAARMDLGTLASDLTGLTVVARTPGAAGNAMTVALVYSGPIGVYFQESPDGVLAIFYNGPATIGDVTAALAAADPGDYPSFRFEGALTGNSATLLTDTFTATALAGGSDQQIVPMGLTATLTEFADRPVWDRRIDVNGTVADSIQSMNEPQDLGGLPFTAQTADRSDWGRSVVLSRDIGPEYQWLKKFLYTVKGSWKSWWLPTWRPDMVAVSVAAGTLTIESDDFSAWYPEERSAIMVRETSGTITYASISNAVDNGDGTTTLSIEDDAATPINLASVPSLVSWLDVCHFDTDTLSITFKNWRFEFSALARAVWQ